jgi:hypothetical protein
MTTKVPNSMLQTPSAGGAVAQVKSASTSATFNTTSGGSTVDNVTPDNTVGAELLTVTLTPTSASNFLEVEAIVQCASTGTGIIAGSLFRDAATTPFAGNLVTAVTANTPYQLVVRARLAAGSTAATTIKLRVGSSGASSVRVNTASGGGALLGGVAVTSLTVTEVTP